MEIGVSIEGMMGLTWPLWKHFVREIEQMGFAGLYRSDHFTMTNPPDLDSLEMMVSLTFLASTSQTVHFGPLVSPLSVRDPVMLARQAMALDDLSGGRMILGVGAGWIEREHTMFGYDLGDMATRMARFAEGLKIITCLIRDSQPVNFEGRFFQLREAQLLPRPQRATPVMVGGNGPRRTLPLAAAYADIWNCVLRTPEKFQGLNARLDELLQAHGRAPGDVKRTIEVPVLCWRNAAERERRLNWFRAGLPDLARFTIDELAEHLRSQWAAILGTPDEVIAHMRAYAAAGAEELIVQWFGLEDTEGLAIIAEHVSPLLAV